MNQRRRDYYGRAHDERVEPYGEFTPDMPDPDWNSVLINPEQKKMPVGDPTLWGNNILTPIDTSIAGPPIDTIIKGDQVVMVQAADHYSRSWSLIGTLTAPQDAWNGSGPANPPGFSRKVTFADYTTTPLEVWLSITQGIEKTTFEQQILLMSGGTGFGHQYGLCNQQYAGVNGPYGATFTSPLAEEGQQTRAFAIIGGLIANTITVRGIFVRAGATGGGLIPDVTLTCVVTPYAPGAGI